MHACMHACMYVCKHKINDDVRLWTGTIGGLPANTAWHVMTDADSEQRFREMSTVLHVLRLT